MNEFDKIKINSLLEHVTDVTFTPVNFKDSYVYYASKLVTKEFHEYEREEFDILKAIYELIAEQIKDAKVIKDHQTVFYGHTFRCNIIKSVAGNMIHCRHMPFEFMLLKNTGINQITQQELLHPRLNKGGLLFISGAPGNGKSTTAAGVIKERLHLFGGVCICLEDPVEIPLHGKHGNGRCIQVPIETTFADAIKSSLRSYPAGQNCMLFVGEMRDAESAIAALQAAIDGRLVITTFHTEDIMLAFERMANLLSELKSEEESYFLMAQAFRVGIHQRIVKKPEKMSLRTSLLVDTHEVYSFIKNKKISGLQQARETQYIEFNQGNRIKYRTD